MGEKFGYITSCDGTRENGASGKDVAYSEVDAKYDEVAGPVKVFEYNGGRVSSGIGRVGGAITRELELFGEEDDRVRGASVSRFSSSVVSRRSCAFSGGKIISELERSER